MTDWGSIYNLPPRNTQPNGHFLCPTWIYNTVGDVDGRVSLSFLAWQKTHK